LLTWSLVSLPLVYLLNSSMASLLYIVGITMYGVSVTYDYPFEDGYIFWGLLLLITPHYYQLTQNKPKNNFTVLHHLFVVVSILIMLFSFTEDDGYGHLMLIAYFSLFGVYYLIGKSDFFKNQKSYLNAYLVLGSAGSLILMLIASFRWWWDDWSKAKTYQLEYFDWGDLLFSSEFFATILITGIGVYLLLQNLKEKSFQELAAFKWAFVPLFLLFFLGKNFPLVSTVLTNILVFAVGILTIRRGVDSNHLGILNYGLLTITALILCRFFDLDLTFIVRGILFVLIGIGFFIANYRMLQKRKQRL